MRLSRTTKSFFMTLVVWLTVFWFVVWSAFSGTDTVWSCPSGLLIDIGSRENPPTLSATVRRCLRSPLLEGMPYTRRSGEPGS